MNKKKEEYLERLTYYLDESDFDQAEVYEVLDDYEVMIDEALEQMDEDESLETVLGNPREIVRNLRKSVVIRRVKGNKFVALSPFIATIAFFVLGFGFELWNPGWLVFLLIPISGVISSKPKSPSKLIEEVMPLIAILLFIGLGLVFEAWHPGWLVFFLIPVGSAFNSRLKYKYIAVISFIIIPVIYLLSYLYFPFEYNWLLFILLVFPAYYTGMISFVINGKRNTKMELVLVTTILISATSFLLLGLLLDAWHPAWLVFLSIPVVSIVGSHIFLNKKLRIVAIMPFISLTLFFLFGEFLDGYDWAWMAFLLIPMVGIIEK